MLYSQGCVLEVAPVWEQWAELTFQGHGGSKEPPIAMVQFVHQPAVTSS